MQDKLEYTGQWWLPENTKRKAAGILRYNPIDGPALELMDSLTEKTDEQLDKKRYDIILGLTADSVPLTLEECAIAGANINPSSFSTFEIRPSRVYAGRHFSAREKIKFKSVLAGYTYLNEWLGVSGISVKRLSDKAEIRARCKSPDIIEYAVGDDLDLGIFIRHDTTGGPLFSKGIGIYQDSYIRFDFKSAAGLEEIKKIVYSTSDFLSLAVNRRSHPLFITGVVDDNEITIIDSQMEAPPERGKLSEYDMAFSFREVRRNFGACLGRWLDKYSILEPLFSAFFSVYDNRRMPLSSRFMNYMMALEIFHRMIFRGKYQNENDFKKTLRVLKSALSGDVPPGARKGIEGRLRQLNDYSLESRLADILKKYRKFIERFISKKDDFISDAVSISDRLMGGAEKNTESRVDPEELYMVSEKLKFIVIICLFSEIGIGKKIIERNQQRAMRLFM